MGTVKFNFKIGQTLYWKEMYSVPYMNKCKMCDGSGEIVNSINNRRMVCPECNGNREIDSGSGSIKERIVSGVVEKIEIEITKMNGERSNDIEIIYSFQTEDGYLTRYEYELYSSDEDIKIGNLCAGYTK